MPSKFVQWLIGGALLLIGVFYSGCRVERSRWVAEQQKLQHWQDSTSKAFALDTLRLRLQIAALTKEAAILANTRDSSLAAANQAAALARVSLQKVAKSRAALAKAETLIDSVTVQAEIITDQDTLLAQRGREIRDLRKTVVTDTLLLANRRYTIDTLNSTIENRNHRISVLDSMLRKASTTPPTEFFGIKLNPGVTFVAGAIAAAAALFVVQAKKP